MSATIIAIVLGVYAAAMTYLRATAKVTHTQVDDKLLALGEKAQAIVDLIKPKEAEVVKTDAVK